MRSGAGERFLLFAQQADQHDERLGAGGGALEIEALSEAGVAAAEKRQRFERGSHGVVIRRGGKRQEVGAAVIYNGSLGSSGKQCGRVFGDQIAVVERQRAAAGDLSTCGHIHDRAGGELRLHAAGKDDDLKTGRTGENVVLLQPVFLKYGGVFAACVGFCDREDLVPLRIGVVQKRLIRLLQCSVDGTVDARRKGVFEKTQRNQRIAGVSAGGGDGAEEKNAGKNEKKKAGAFFHGYSFSP